MLTPKEIKQQALSKQKENKKFLNKLRNKSSREIDKQFHHAHETIFACTNCLSCANCCKTTGPLFTNKDIERIATHLKMKQQQFIEKYLKIDEDNDYVLQKVPCAFLGEDNYCSIYEKRPKACREYPHTDRVKQHQLFSLTLKNTTVCPAVYNILEDLKEGIK